MSDDFGTVNLRRGDRSRELEVLREHYRRHRETLAGLIDNAPTEALAAEYLRLIEQIDRSLLKLGELDTMVVPPPRATTPGRERLPERELLPQRDLDRERPGRERLPERNLDRERVPERGLPERNLERNLERERVTEPAFPVVPPVAASSDAHSFGEHPLLNVEENEPVAETWEGDGARSRVGLILLAAVAAVLLIGWLIWRASSDRTAPVGGEQPIDAVSETVETTAAPDSVAPVVAIFKVTPASHDYGVVRKGTRATRQFEVTNDSDEPISIQLSRSACRCLYYEHAEVIPPRAKEGVTVTVDAAKAKAGALQETVRVTAKGQPDVATSFDVNATVR